MSANHLKKDCPEPPYFIIILADQDQNSLIKLLDLNQMLKGKIIFIRYDERKERTDSIYKNDRFDSMKRSRS